MSDLNFDRLTNDELENLTDRTTDLLDFIKKLDEKYSGHTLPPEIVNLLIAVEAQCCIELDERGLTFVPDDDDTETYVPSTHVWMNDDDEPDPASLTAFADFIADLDFDDDEPAGV